MDSRLRVEGQVAVVATSIDPALTLESPENHRTNLLRIRAFGSLDLGWGEG
jgi:hypothetical protein